MADGRAEQDIGALGYLAQGHTGQDRLDRRLREARAGGNGSLPDHASGNIMPAPAAENSDSVSRLETELEDGMDLATNFSLFTGEP